MRMNYRLFHTGLFPVSERLPERRSKFGAGAASIIEMDREPVLLRLTAGTAPQSAVAGRSSEVEATSVKPERHGRLPLTATC
jgi:hypothetical protein